ncbi:ArsC family reductase [Alkalimarinus coralli]|uniref:ArsC family reductase n=1 Tax=Alkalimarinus coralli TaxID=2935863 RepID=UPI00351319E2
MYGIKNCDTIKKARKWLDEKGIGYTFHDYKKDGTNEALFQDWLSSLGWEAVINRRGTTWRKLSEEQKSSMDNSSALAVMMENPSIIKRPLLEHEGKRILGFKAEEYESAFK